MKYSRILMIVGVLLLGLLFVYPLWNIELGAPQYPEPLGMDIWINKIVGSHENDIQNINLMNHYVGMKEIPEYMPEFDIFPKVITAMVILGVIIGAIGKPWMFLSWSVLIVLLGIAGMYDFYLWEYDYGHSLNPKAAIKFTNEMGEPMAYQPPLFGTKLILNFTATSLPMSGAYFMFSGIILTFVSYFIARKEVKKKALKINSVLTVGTLLLLATTSCSIEPSPINYGSDACSFCKMNIVDKQHGAEIVTKKGKVYKYDAIECLLNDLKTRDENEIGMFLVNTFDTPIELSDASTVTYLISQDIPSPMGAFLSAFTDEKEASKHQGETLNWDKLKVKFSEKVK